MSGRIRCVKPEWLDDEKLGAASDAARVLSIGLLLLADDYGRGRAHPLYLASHVWAYGDPQETLRKVSGAITELLKIGFIHLYDVGGQSYFVIKNWIKHQKVQHPSAPRVPEPNKPEIPPPEPDGGKSLMSPQASETTGRKRGRPRGSKNRSSGEPQESLVRDSGESQASLTPDQDQDQDQDLKNIVEFGKLDSGSDAGASEPPSPVREVFEYWRAIIGKPRARLDAKRRRRIEWAVRTYDVATAKLAIDGCARSDFHMGRDPKTGGKSHNDVELIFRDATHFERFRDFGERPREGRIEPPPPSAYRQVTDEEFHRELEEAFGPMTDEDIKRVNRGVRFNHG